MSITSNNHPCEAGAFKDATSGKRSVLVVVSEDWKEVQVNDMQTLLLSLGYDAKLHVIDKTNYVSQLKDVPRDTVLWVMYDMLDDERASDECVSMAPAQYIEKEFHRVGGCSTAYQLTCCRKSIMYRKFEAAGVPFPGAVMISDLKELDENAGIQASLEKMGGPFFVKVDAGYDSLGLSSSCIQDTVSGILEQARNLLSKYGPVVIQRYLGGREFTVAVSGNESFGVCERLFGDGELISPQGGTKGWTKLDEADPLCAQVQALALSAFKAVGGNSYGLVDIRCDKESKPYVLEVNPDCSIAPQSYFELSCQYAGRTREGVMNKLVEDLFKR